MSGRFPWDRERAVAIAAIGHEARDAILNFMDKEERLFKDFSENVGTIPTKIPH